MRPCKERAVRTVNRRRSLFNSDFTGAAVAVDSALDLFV